MAIEFLQAQKRQRYLILILTLAICAIVLVVWLGFFRTSAPVVPASSSIVVQSKIKINWDILSDSRLKELQNFQQIPVLKDKIGRINPFTPY